MKGILSAITASVVVFALGACGGRPQAKGAEGFPETEMLIADSIAINEVLEPQEMALAGGYAAIFTPKTGKALFRYKLPGWEFADSSMVVGEGPDDLAASVFFFQKSDTDGLLWVSEPNKRKIVLREPLPSGMKKAREIKIPDNGTWIWQGSVLGDSTIVYYSMNYAKDYTRGDGFIFTASAAGDTLEKRDSIQALSGAKVERVTANGKTMVSVRTYNAPVFGVSAGRIAVFYSETENVDFYGIGPGGKMGYLRTHGDTLSLAQVEQMDFEQLRKKKDYTEQLAASTDKYLYFQRIQYDRAPGEKEDKDNPRKVTAQEIKIYDWDMNPVRKFELDHPAATRVYIDEKNGRIYAYGWDRDFEQVYVYGYKL